jgi:hypothetical protein
VSREDYLNIDAVEIHIGQLDLRILVAFAESPAEGSVPSFRGEERPRLMLLTQMPSEAFQRFGDMSIGIYDWKTFHVDSPDRVFAAIALNCSTFEIISRSLLTSR